MKQLIQKPLYSDQGFYDYDHYDAMKMRRVDDEIEEERVNVGMGRDMIVTLCGLSSRVYRRI